MSAHVVTDGIPATPAPAMFVHVLTGSGDGSGMIFRWEGPPVAPKPGVSGDARPAYSFRLRCCRYGKANREIGSSPSHYGMAPARCQAGQVHARATAGDCDWRILARRAGDNYATEQRVDPVSRAGGRGHSGCHDTGQARRDAPTKGSSHGSHLRRTPCRGHRRPERRASAATRDGYFRKVYTDSDLFAHALRDASPTALRLRLLRQTRCAAVPEERDSGATSDGARATLDTYARRRDA